MRGAKILLVDDEVVFTDNMSTLLEARGYIVTAVNNGESAIRALEESKFDVMVLDLKMPGMDGMEVLAEVRRLRPLIQVIMLTGHGTIESAVEGLQQGAYDYLLKPYDFESLFEKLQEAVEKKRAQELKIQAARHQEIILRHGKYKPT